MVGVLGLPTVFLANVSRFSHGCYKDLTTMVPHIFLSCHQHKAMPHLLELYAGTGSIGKVFAAAGWKVTSVDIRADFHPKICKSVLDLKPDDIDGRVDLVWGSPPCTQYSVARTKAKTPRDLELSLIHI